MQAYCVQVYCIQAYCVQVYISAGIHAAETGIIYKHITF